MKFLIQKIHKEIRHDFSFHLIQSIHYKKWIDPTSKVTIKYLNYDPTEDVPEPDDIYPIPFQERHKGYCPIGSVEFVTEYLHYFYGLTPKPRNVPEELFHYAGREIFNGSDLSFKNLKGRFFFKSNNKIKGCSGYYDSGIPTDLPEGSYQISEFIPNITSEWRVFVYEKNLVGLQNYTGDFTKWPNMNTIRGMIGNYISAPIAYTLDVAISEDRGTFVIECHDFFSCGLYGFSDYRILPNMFYRWFQEYLKFNLF